MALCRIGALILVPVALIGCSESGGGVDTEAEPAGAKRNLILIAVDTLRADHLGCYGSDIPTPHIDGLAAAGAMFSTARAHIPLTGPSHASLFTSSVPSDHGCTVNSQSFPEENHTLAEILSEQGWATAAFVSLGVLSDRFGFAQGFDTYGGTFIRRWWKSSEEINARLSKWLRIEGRGSPLFLFVHYSDPHSPYAPPSREYPIIEIRRGGEVLASVPADSRDHDVTVEVSSLREDFELVLPEGVSSNEVGCRMIRTDDRRVTVKFAEGDEFLQSNRGAPGFKNLPRAFRLINLEKSTKEVTLQVTLREQLNPETLIARYREEVAYVDSQIGLAIEALQAAGLWENSVVVFTADHGEGLGEHNLIGHVDQLYDSLLHVPLIVVAPGLVQPGTVIDAPAGHVDILPTVLDLLGVSVTDRFRGVSLMPWIEGTGPTNSAPILGETHKPEAKTNQRSIVQSGFKYILHQADGSEELYDLAQDPGEEHDLASQMPEKLALMGDLLLSEFGREFGPGVAGENLDLSEEDKVNLKGIGYAR
jgi:arylsulfatase A-like enzyme